MQRRISRYNQLKAEMEDAMDAFMCPLCHRAYPLSDLNWDTDPMECQTVGCPAMLKLAAQGLMVRLRPATLTGMLLRDSGMRFEDLLERVKETLEPERWHLADDLERAYLLLLADALPFVEARFGGTPLERTP